MTAMMISGGRHSLRQGLVGPMAQSWWNGPDMQKRNWVSQVLPLNDNAITVPSDPNGEAESSDGDHIHSKRKKKTANLERGTNGHPLLPDLVIEGKLTFDKMHPIIREY